MKRRTFFKVVAVGSMAPIAVVAAPLKVKSIKLKSILWNPYMTSEADAVDFNILLGKNLAEYIIRQYQRTIRQQFMLDYPESNIRLIKDET